LFKEKEATSKQLFELLSALVNHKNHKAVSLLGDTDIVSFHVHVAVGHQSSINASNDYKGCAAGFRP
jgi:hypothetical protein